METNDIVITRTAVESSNIKSVGYDADTQTLEVEFTHGTFYRYAGVPEKTFGDMAKAESVGKFFAANVRDAFKAKRFFPKEPVVLIDSPEAAHYQTGIRGWVSRRGHYFGEGANGEGLARYDGCTHVPCGGCGKPVEKGWTACDGCRNLAEIARYEAMPRAEWDGKAMLYSQALDRWYDSPDDAAENLGEVDGIDELSDMRLVICKPVGVRQLESDYCADDMAEDQELPGAIIDAMNAFNKAVAGIIVSWEPGKTALATRSDEG
jgi:hypothetical protein